MTFRNRNVNWQIPILLTIISCFYKSLLTLIYWSHRLHILETQSEREEFKRVQKRRVIHSGIISFKTRHSNTTPRFSVKPFETRTMFFWIFLDMNCYLSLFLSFFNLTMTECRGINTKVTICTFAWLIILTACYIKLLWHTKTVLISKLTRY